MDGWRAKILILLGPAALLGTALPGSLLAQQAPPTAAAPLRHAVELVESGRCAEAFPILKHGLAQVTDKRLRYQARMATVRCAMALGQQQTALDTLLQLEHDAPGDPEVLYIASHLFSEMGMRAAQELQARAPSSYQAQRLEAESLESQGKNEAAAAIYRKILDENPKIPGIHYRLGQIDFALAGDTGSTDAAKAEFEKETEVDPTNAAAEFILGELARRASNLSEAVRHFSRATKLDAGFSEAYLALGMSLAASGNYPDAKTPLESYVKMEPDDPAGHYQLALAYSHTGDQQGANREMALQAQAAARARGATDNAEGHAVHP